ncbi:winged helix-turn-helix domain-containing protein [Pelagibacteraceae bacterium]|jgi:DNA-binding response OmpR family regulator|nr:winged helix-turn-helix domain-containing protein [Pelagibacteraceae bacterium]
MHQFNVLILGPNNFISTLIELKSFLKFNLYDDILSANKQKIKLDILIIHKDVLSINKRLNILSNNNIIKILATKSIEKNTEFDAILKLPIKLSEINSIVEQLSAKKTFIKNSSIKIKNYFLDKNEKKLIKDKSFIILTEKEIQLLELFIGVKKPISKNKILLSVWNYSNDADTHTVETHIYRLRKKISDKFSDINFILSHKDGYYI